MNSFENYFEEFSGNKVITFEKAEKAKKTFNDLALTTPFEEFAERIEIEKVLNFEEKSKK